LIVRGRKRVNRIHYHLDTRGIKELPFSEIKAILRGADHLIGRGGRNPTPRPERQILASFKSGIRGAVWIFLK
jgi:hypothetical protein